MVSQQNPNATSKAKIQNADYQIRSALIERSESPQLGASSKDRSSQRLPLDYRPQATRKGAIWLDLWSQRFCPSFKNWPVWDHHSLLIPEGLFMHRLSWEYVEQFQTLFRKNNDDENTIVHHYSLESVSAVAKLLNVLLAVDILIIPVFILLWIPENRAWISATVLISVLVFSTLMSLFTKARVQDVLVGTAA